MNSIFTALSQGYTASQVLNFLSHSIPKLGKSIKKAQNFGYDANQILGFLSKSSNTSFNPGMSESEIHAANKRQDAQLTKYGLIAGGAIAASPLAAAAARGALSRALPGHLKPTSPGLPGPIGTTNIGASSTLPSPSAPIQQQPQSINLEQNFPQQPPTNVSPDIQVMGNQAQINSLPGVQTQPSATNITQPTSSSQVSNLQRDPKINIDKIKNLGEDGRIKNLIEGGLPTQDIAALLKSVMPKDKYKALEASEGGIEGAIEDYASELQRSIAQQPVAQLNEPNQMPEMISAEPIIGAEFPKEELKTETKPIEKNQIVSSPQGIGEVKEIRNGKAIIDIDGKKHKVDVEELDPLEFTEEEVADAYNDLMAKIPEQYKSGFIQWAGYDEDRNVLGFIPRDGKYEELHNITPEEAKLIKEGKGIARTTGATREGLWVVGEDTRGGIISQIIHDRRKRKKSEEEKQLSFGFDLPKAEKQDKGMKPIFDELSYPRSLSRERDRRLKLEERQRKKDEREAAKKRKK